MMHRAAWAIAVGVVWALALAAPVSGQEGGEEPATAPASSEAPASTGAPASTDAPPPASGSTERVEGEGADILVLLIVGMGGLLVIGTLVHFSRRSRERRSAWHHEALGAYREGVWVHDTLVPGRFGTGLEARSLLTDAGRRVASLRATIAALEVEAPDATARAALADVADAAETLRVAFESDLAVRSAAPSAGEAGPSDLETASATVVRRRGELDEALTRLRSGL